MNLRLKIPQDYKSSGSKMRTGDLKTTYYVLDAQGNAMSNYSFTTRATDVNANKLVLQERNIYGSKRVSIEQLQLVVAEPVYVTPDTPWEDVWGLPAYTPISMRDYHWSWYKNRPSVPVSTYKQEIGDKRYELANHLGNVLNVVTDRKLPVADANDNTKIAYFTADVVSFADYLPYGQLAPNRHGSEGSYRYGFNGMERIDEMEGEGNAYDFGARLYNPRLARWSSIDALASKYPNMSPYNFVGNNPILFVDPDGNEWVNSYDKQVQDLTKMSLNNPNDKDIKGKLNEAVENQQAVNKIISNLKNNDVALYNYIDKLTVVDSKSKEKINVKVNVSLDSKVMAENNQDAQTTYFNVDPKTQKYLLVDYDNLEEEGSFEGYIERQVAPFNNNGEVGFDVTIFGNKNCEWNDIYLSNEAGDVMYRMEYPQAADKSGTDVGKSMDEYLKPGTAGHYSKRVEELYSKRKKDNIKNEEQSNPYPIVNQTK